MCRESALLGLQGRTEQKATSKQVQRASLLTTLRIFKLAVTQIHLFRLNSQATVNVRSSASLCRVRTTMAIPQDYQTLKQWLSDIRVSRRTWVMGRRLPTAMSRRHPRRRNSLQKLKRAICKASVQLEIGVD